NTHFLMHPQAFLIRKHNDDMFINGNPDDAFQGYGGNGAVIIEGGILEGNALEHPDGFNGINFGHAQGLIFKDITIRDISYAHAIEINACKDVLFDGCRFEGFYDPTPTKERYISEAIQLDLAKSADVFESFGDYDNTPCHNVKITNCYFGPSDNFPAWNRGAGSHSCTHDRWHDTIRILNNTFEGIQDYSVYCFKWNNVLVSENNLNDSAGIAVRIPDPNTESTLDA
ncbi:plasmin and fibronectin-binding protein A, partial [Bacillus cereus]